MNDNEKLAWNQGITADMISAEKSDPNYYKTQKFEIIDLLEDLANRDIPNVPKMNLIMAQKYLGRIGKKSGTWKSEAIKVIDFTWRAVFGEWSPLNGKSLEISKGVAPESKYK